MPQSWGSVAYCALLLKSGIAPIQGLHIILVTQVELGLGIEPVQDLINRGMFPWETSQVYHFHIALHRVDDVLWTDITYTFAHNLEFFGSLQQLVEHIGQLSLTEVGRLVHPIDEFCLEKIVEISKGHLDLGISSTAAIQTCILDLAVFCLSREKECILVHLQGLVVDISPVLVLSLVHYGSGYRDEFLSENLFLDHFIEVEVLILYLPMISFIPHIQLTIKLSPQFLNIRQLSNTMWEKKSPANSNIQTPMANNFFRLNASEFESSTPGLSISDPKGPLIEFEQYELQGKQIASPLHLEQVKKIAPFGTRKLTIKIDDSFPFEDGHFVNKIVGNQYQKPSRILKIDESSQQSEQSQQNESPTSSLSHSSNSHLQNNTQTIFEPLTNEPSQSREESHGCQRYQSSHSLSKASEVNNEYLNQIEKLTARVITVQEKLFYYEDYNKKLLRENHVHQQAIEEGQREGRKLTALVRKKDQSADQNREKVQVLMERILQLEKEKENIAHTGNRSLEIKFEKLLRQREQQIKQLHKKNQKVQTINKVLQRQLRESQKKVIEVQKQMHRTTCNNFYENVARLKESSMKLRDSRNNKENNHMNASSHAHTHTHGHSTTTNTRKSLEIKKNSGGISRGQRTNSSNVNLLAKKLGHK